MSFTHLGEEAGLIIKGQIDLHLDGKVFQLETGDSFSSRPACHTVIPTLATLKPRLSGQTRL